MAYLRKEVVQTIRANLKREFPNYKFSITNIDHCKLSVAIMKAPVRFSDKGYVEINHYYPDDYENSEILKKIIKICNETNYNNSNAQIDYFDVGYYFSISQGKWDREFIHVV